MTRRTVRRDVDVRREEILTATVLEVERRGFAQVRVSDVAAALGVSPGLVFYHFATKDRLLADALTYAVERDLARLDAALRRGRDAIDRLGRALRLYAPQGGAPGWPVWIDAWGAALRSPELRAEMGRLDGRWRAAVEEVLREGVVTGEFVCADPAASAARLAAFVDGLSVRFTVHGGITHAELTRWVRAAAEGELGLAPGVLRGP